MTTFDFKAQLPQVVNFIKEAAKALKAEHHIADLKIDEDECIIYFWSDAITVQPGETEIKTIGGPRTKEVWTVSLWHHVPATRDTPPDCDEQQVGFRQNALGIAQLAIHTLLKCVVDNYFAGIEDALAAEQWANDPML